MAVVGSDGGFALVDVEAVMLPGEELVGLALGTPLEFEETMEHSVPEELCQLLAAGSSDEVKLVRFVEYASSGEAMDVRVIGEVVAEGMNGEDDTNPSVANSRLFAQPVLQAVGDEVAEFGETLRIFAQDITQDSRDGGAGRGGKLRRGYRAVSRERRWWQLGQQPRRLQVKGSK